jgi:metallo-beta-lactamase family protein
MNKRELKRLTRTGQAFTKLHILGSAEQVTGSMMLFEHVTRESTTRFLLDVGLTVENDKADFMNRLPSGITPADIDFIVISHAHIDHSGYLPRLTKLGFTGKVYLTDASADLLDIMLPDSGFLQEEAARKNCARAERQKNAKLASATTAGDKHTVSEKPKRRSRSRAAICSEPLYTQADAKHALTLLQRGMKLNTRYELAPEVAVKFTEAGHILGAAVVTLELGAGSKKRTFCFTGNIGRSEMPLLQTVAAVKSADYVMSESTYGNRVHEKRDRLGLLAEILNRAIERAKTPSPKHGFGVILIPAFAVGRGQTILADIRQLQEDGRIPRIKVVVDSPMMIRSTEVHRKHKYLLSAETQALFAEGVDPFRTEKQVETMDRAHSQALDEPQSEPMIIIGSSGMAAGGRIVNHLKARLPGRQNTVVFVGYQGTGTLGNQLIGRDARRNVNGTTIESTTQNVRVVRIYGEPVKVYANIEFMSDYSAHGDVNDILGWMSKFERKPKQVFLVHGDDEALTGLKETIEKRLRWSVTVPKARDVFTLE